MIASPEGTNNGSVFVDLLLNSFGQPAEMSGRAITATQSIFYLEVFHIYSRYFYSMGCIFKQYLSPKLKTFFPID